MTTFEIVLGISVITILAIEAIVLIVMAYRGHKEFNKLKRFYR